jgi:hypothetical protein
MAVGIIVKKGSKKPRDLERAGQFSAEELADLRQRIAQAKIETVEIRTLKPNPRNAKKHPSHQIALLAENINKFGFYSTTHR